MKATLLTLLLAVAATVAQTTMSPEDQAIMNVLDSISKKASAPAPNCRCVAASNCVNGKIITKGQGRIKLRNGACGPGEVCCGGSNPSGGNPSGGNPSGGNPSGGNPSGGNPSGGNPSGGNPSGGNPSGGSPGGNPSGGNPSGGSPGGNPSGGKPSGGSPGGNPSGGNPSGVQTPGGNASGVQTPGGNPPGVKQEQCGMRDGGGSFRAGMFDPNEPGPEEFPWTTAILKKSDQSYVCVGSLIHPRVVLSSAHNFRYLEAKDVFIRAGDHDRTSDDGQFNPQDSDVVEIVKHEGYSQVKKSNDASLLFLAKELDDSAPNVGFVCLPAAALQTPPGTSCIVAGWGAKEFGGRILNSRKMVELPIVDTESCLTALLKVPHANQKFRIHESMVCAGGVEGVDTCRGDGGAPLVCSYTAANDIYYQAGIASWGIGCGVKGRPAVYTSVAQIRQWIDQKMAEKGYDSKSYTAVMNV